MTPSAGRRGAACKLQAFLVLGLLLSACKFQSGPTATTDSAASSKSKSTVHEGLRTLVKEWSTKLLALGTDPGSGAPQPVRQSHFNKQEEIVREFVQKLRALGAEPLVHSQPELPGSLKFPPVIQLQGHLPNQSQLGFDALRNLQDTIYSPRILIRNFQSLHGHVVVGLNPHFPQGALFGSERGRYQVQVPKTGQPSHITVPVSPQAHLWLGSKTLDLLFAETADPELGAGSTRTAGAHTLKLSQIVLAANQPPEPRSERLNLRFHSGPTAPRLWEEKLNPQNQLRLSAGGVLPALRDTHNNEFTKRVTHNTLRRLAGYSSTQLTFLFDALKGKNAVRAEEALAAAEGLLAANKLLIAGVDAMKQRLSSLYLPAVRAALEKKDVNAISVERLENDLLIRVAARSSNKSEQSRSSNAEAAELQLLLRADYLLKSSASTLERWSRDFTFHKALGTLLVDLLSSYGDITTMLHEKQNLVVDLRSKLLRLAVSGPEGRFKSKANASTRVLTDEEWAPLSELLTNLMKSSPDDKPVVGGTRTLGPIAQEFTDMRLRFVWSTQRGGPFEKTFHDIPKKQSVVFNLRAPNVNWFDLVYLVGETPELGEWKPEKALEMEAVGSFLWQTELELPAESKISYKFLVQRDGDHNPTAPRKWELLDGNRTVSTEKEGTPLQLETIEATFPN